MLEFLKLSPVILLAVMVVNGVDILISASIGLFVAAFICKFTDKMKFADIMNEAVEGAKEATLLAFILMLAYALAEIFMSTGVGAAAISIFLHVGVTGKTVAVVAFLTTCVLSVSTGTSWGTFAACIPIFIWLCNVVGGNPAMTFAAAVGGSAFGDNIGLISDTTILSSGLQGVKVVDRIRAQGPGSVLCVILAAICFYSLSVAMGLPDNAGDPSKILAAMSQETIKVLEEERPAVLTLLAQVKDGVPLYMIIPVIIVVTMAVMRMDTISCLSTGIVCAIAFGYAAGTVTSISDVIGLVQSGFESAGSWAVIMLFWAMGFGAVMRRMDAFGPIAAFFVKISRRVRHLVVCNGLLCLIINATVNEEMSQMATVGPVLKDIINNNVEGSEEDKYKLRNRNALFSDAVGVHSAALIPWHTGVAYYMGLAAAVYPLYHFTIGDLYYNFMGIICVVSIYVLTFTGWDRYIPLFGLPEEPAVRLKKVEERDYQMEEELLSDPN